MRIAFFGSGDFAVPTLSRLAADGHEIAAVFTQPDRPAGRGSHLHQTPVKVRALELGLPVLQPETLRDGTALADLKRLTPEVAVVVAYGHLIPKDMLREPPQGFVNLHASLLPKFRGAAPVPHAVLAGEAETGVTVFRLNERWDAGDVLARAKTPIHPDDTSATLLERLAPIGAGLVLEVVGEMEAGWVSPTPQIEAEATKAPKLAKEMGLIDWSLPGAQIDRMARAFQPWPLAYSFAPSPKGPLRVAILKVEPAPPPRRPAAPGTILLADGREGLIVKTGDGALWLREVKPEGKRAMDGAAWVRGAHLTPGSVLG